MLTSYLQIFVILTIGYVFINNWNWTKFKIIRFNGQEILLQSGAWGTAIYIIGNLTYPLFLEWSVFVDYVQTGILDNYTDQDKQNIFPSSICGSIIAISFVIISNNIFLRRKKAIDQVVRANNDAIELILLECLSSWKKAKEDGDFQSILVTLVNGKCYVGIVTETFFSNHNDSFQLQPLASGYRDKDTKVFNINSYYEDQSEQDLLISIPTSNVLSISWYVSSAKLNGPPYYHGKLEGIPKRAPEIDLEMIKNAQFEILVVKDSEDLD